MNQTVKQVIGTVALGALVFLDIRLEQKLEEREIPTRFKNDKEKDRYIKYLQSEVRRLEGAGRKIARRYSLGRQVRALKECNEAANYLMAAQAAAEIGNMEVMACMVKNSRSAEKKIRTA